MILELGTSYFIMGFKLGLYGLKLKGGGFCIMGFK